MYIQILVILAALSNKLQLQLALDKYTKHLLMLWEMYTWDSIRVYHFDFHQSRILEEIDIVQVWKMLDHELKPYLLVAQPIRNTNLHDSRNTHIKDNLSTPCTKIHYK